MTLLDDGPGQDVTWIVSPPAWDDVSAEDLATYFRVLNAMLDARHDDHEDESAGAAGAVGAVGAAGAAGVAGVVGAVGAVGAASVADAAGAVGAAGAERGAEPSSVRPLGSQPEPRAMADSLAARAPDAALAAELAAIDATEVDEYTLVEMAAGYQRVVAWANAGLTSVAGELARRPVVNARGALPDPVDAGNMASDELAPRLGISRWAARRMVRNARCFRNTFFETGQALTVGDIDVQKASTIVSMLEDYAPEMVCRVQQDVLPDAGLQTHAQLVAAIRRAIIALAHDDADHLHAKARAKRRVDHPRQLPDGMASMLAILPATDAVSLDLALETAARTARRSGDQRTLDQLRADTLSLMGHAALENGYVGIQPTSHAAPPLSPAPPAPPESSATPELSEPPNETTAQPREGDTTPRPSRVVPGPDGTATPGTGPDGTATPGTGCEGAATPGTDSEGTATPGTDSEGTATPGTDSDGTVTPGTGSDGTVTPGTGSEGTHAPSRDAGGSFAASDGAVDGADRPPEPPTGACPGSHFMPLGQISGGRARISITVPLSVLLPPDIAHQLGLPATATFDPSPTGTAHPPAMVSGAPAESTDHDHPLPGPAAAGAELVSLPEEDELLAFLERDPVEVAELDGYGPISPAVARAAVLGGTWRRIVTDPLSGIVLDHGRTRYRPPADLAELVRLRDGSCVRPGCSSPVRACELDHTIAWGNNGTTALINLGNLCLRDHLIKTSGAFQLKQLEGGAFDWTTPSGHVYRRGRGGRVTFRGSVPSRMPDVGPLPF